MLERLSPEAAEAGRESALVEALVRDLEARHANVQKMLNGAAADGSATAAMMAALGGRLAEVERTLRLIAEAGSGHG